MGCCESAEVVEIQTHNPPVQKPKRVKVKKKVRQVKRV